MTASDVYIAGIKFLKSAESFLIKLILFILFIAVFVAIAYLICWAMFSFVMWDMLPWSISEWLPMLRFILLCFSIAAICLALNILAG